MRARSLICLTVGVAAAIAAGIAAAGGYSPGFAPKGVLAPGGHVRYVAVSSSRATVLKAVRVGGRQVLRTASLRGAFGVPMVANDGTAGGLTRDGRTLVVSTLAGTAPVTRFAVLDTKSFKVRQMIRLGGPWAFDALSANGDKLFLIQYVSTPNAIHYVVRAYDLGLHQLVAGAIADKTEPGPMSGFPISRVTSADGTWAYTLYQRGNGEKPFIHALDTRDRVAVCIDLAWQGDPNNLGNVRLTLSPDEKQLVVRRLGDGKALMSVAAPG